MTSQRGWAAEYGSAEQLLETVQQLRWAGYSQLEAFAPYPVEGLGELIARRPTPMAKIMGVAALAGIAGGYFLQWYAAHDFPLNVGGRPLHSWPAFIPVTFELTVLTTALVGAAALLWLTRLPRLDHPMFGDSRFRRASADRFFVYIKASDPVFNAGILRRLLEQAAPVSIGEVIP